MSDSRALGDRLSGLAVFLVMGWVADLGGVVQVFANPAFRAWVKEYSRGVALTCMLLAAVVLSLASVCVHLRKKLAEAEAELQRLQSSPTEHDAIMFATFDAYASPQGDLMMWLSNFVDREVTVANRDLLSGLVSYFDREARGFSDPDLNAAYGEFMAAVRGMFAVITGDMDRTPNRDVLMIPLAWRGEQQQRYDDALIRMQEAHTLLLRRRNELYLVAQRKGLTSNLDPATRVSP